MVAECSSSQPSPALNEKEGEKEREEKEVLAVKERAMEESKETSQSGSGSAGGLLEVIEIDESSEAMSQLSGVEEVGCSRPPTASSSSDLPNRSVSLVRQFKSLPFEDVDVGYLDDDDDMEGVVEELGEDCWPSMQPLDTFAATMGEATRMIKRLVQEATFSSIAPSPSPLASSTSPVLPAILGHLTDAHKTDIQCQRRHYLKRLNEAQKRLSDVKRRAKSQLLAMKDDVERRLSVMNSVMLEHDRRHQRELEEELTRIRIEEWQKRDEEMLALHKEKRNEQEQVAQHQPHPYPTMSALPSFPSSTLLIHISPVPCSMSFVTVECGAH